MVVTTSTDDETRSTDRPSPPPRPRKLLPLYSLTSSRAPRSPSPARARSSEAEPQLLPGERWRAPDELGRVDAAADLGPHALVLLEDGGRDNEVVLALVELEELQNLAPVSERSEGESQLAACSSRKRQEEER